jgi:hypothetical protein
MSINVYPPKAARTIDFTSSSTWTVPSGVYSADFLVVGAGGGGSAVQDTSNARSLYGGGGGGGSVKEITLSVTPGQTYTITVGAKGLGGTNGSTAATNGGFSEIVLSGTTLIRCFGGRGAASRLDNTNTNPSLTASVAGGAGTISAAASSSGGGGGAGIPRVFGDDASTSDVNISVEGTRGKTGAANDYVGIGAAGINGYGSGGGAGTARTPLYANAVAYGSGAGGTASGAGTAANGSSATVAGCGGGGGARTTLLGTSTGGDGADGLVRIKYVG